MEMQSKIYIKDGQASVQLAGQLWPIEESQDLLYVVQGPWAVFFGPEDSARIRAIIRSLRHIEELNSKAFILN